MNSKLAVPLEDGLVVEAVYYPSGTLCVSSQAGCAVGCPYCASGSRGLRRNLSFAELLEQVTAACAAGYRPQRLTVSGIGEPLHNPEAVRALVLDGQRRGLPVSLTSCGGAPSRLRAFLELPHNGLMLSLHAGRETTRRALVPGGPPLGALREVLAAAWPLLSVRARRRIGFNYLLFAGRNDSSEELADLLDWLAPFPEATVHLLAPAAGTDPEFRPSLRQSAAFAQLRERHPRVRRGNRWRTLAEGGCGTLFVRSLAAGASARMESQHD